KIEAVVLDGQKVLWRQRVATPKNDYGQTLQAIASLVGEAKQVCGLSQGEAIGIGAPGALTDSVTGPRVMKNCNSVVLNGKPLLEDLKRLLACEVYLENDANCFALAETLAGSGKEGFGAQVPEISFGVILGTGVGSGLVVNGKVLAGLHSIAGEWGHNCLPALELDKLPEPERGRLCYCGRKDCIETYLSGPGLAMSYHLRYAQVLSSEEIISAMRAKDAKAADIWQSYLNQLAASLAQVVNILDPQIIILGGGMSNIIEIYSDINERMAAHVFTEHAKTPIVCAKLGDSAGVYGAAYLGEGQGGLKGFG
ncbi:ROK family protein, partial [Oleiphilus sp. HI0086]